MSSATVQPRWLNMSGYPILVSVPHLDAAIHLCIIAQIFFPFHAVIAPYYIQIYLNGVLWDRGAPPKFNYYPYLNDDGVSMMMPPIPTIGAILKRSAIEGLTGLQVVLTTDDNGTVLERYDRIELKGIYTNIRAYANKLL